MLASVSASGAGVICADRQAGPPSRWRSSSSPSPCSRCAIRRAGWPLVGLWHPILSRPLQGSAIVLSGREHLYETVASVAAAVNHLRAVVTVGVGQALMPRILAAQVDTAALATATDQHITHAWLTGFEPD